MASYIGEDYSLAGQPTRLEDYINRSISCSDTTEESYSCNDDKLQFCNGFQNIRIVYLGLSLLSLLCCVVVFVSYYAFPRLSGYSSNIFIIRTVLDLFIAVGHICSYAIDFLSHRLACQFLGLGFEFLLVAANLWYAVLAYDLIKAIRDPFGSRANSGSVPHLIVWVPSLLAVTVLATTIVSDIGPGPSMFYFCWISVEKTTVNQFALMSLFLYFLPQFVIWLFSVTINLVAVFVILTGFPASSETRRHILKQNTFYVLVLGLETIVLLPLWIAQLVLSSKKGPYFCFLNQHSLIIAFLFAIIHSLRGTIDLFVWWWTFSLGPKDFKDLWSRCSIRRRNGIFSTQDTLCTPLVTPESGESVNKILRKDVMYCINYAILDAVRLNAEEETQRTQLGSVRDTFMAQVMVKWDEDNYQEEAEKKFKDPHHQETHKRRIPFHPSNNLRDFAFIDIEPTVFGLIRSSLGITSQAYQQSFTIKDEQDVESSGMLEKFTEGKSGSFFYFTRDYRYIIKTVTEEEEAFLRKIAFDYYSHIQRNPDSVIVRLYGLHKVRLARLQRYISVVVMENLFYNENGLKMNERYDLKGSTIGRRAWKGSKNSSDKFKKTLKDLDLLTTVAIGREAKQQLMEQLRADVNFLSSLHIMDYSLLLGIHHHTREGSSFHQGRSMNIDIDGDEITFVDIGQSPTGNTPSTPTKVPGSSTSADTRGRTHSSVFNPNEHVTSLSLEDVLEEPSKPYVPWYRRDYGGLRSCSSNHPLNKERPYSSVSYSTDKGDGLSPPSDTYYLGIVDILQVYNLSKKMENFAKTKLLCKNKYGISAVDEKTYARRFLEAMDRITE